jgi:hypothetical protein
LKITISQTRRKKSVKKQLRRIKIPAAAGWRSGETGTVLKETAETICVDFHDGITTGYPRELFLAKDCKFDCVTQNEEATNRNS